MKLILLLAVMLCCGCSGERAQQAANTRAGIHAGVVAIKAGESGKAVQILAGADARLPAVAEVPSVDFPAPAMTTEEIGADPGKYVSTAPPEPKGWGIKALAILGVGGTAALYALKLVAPMIPGGGPIVGKVADMAWSFMAHRDQREADAIKGAVHEAAKTAAPFLKVLMTTDRYSDEVKKVVTPEILSALQRLAAEA